MDCSECDRPGTARGLCQRHYDLAKRAGMPMSDHLRRTPLERLREKYSEDTTTGCWEWNAHRNVQTGYGAFCLNGKTIPAHRASYLLHVGDIPAGMFVFHRCDNMGCVNPAHLFIGTVADNNDDMRSKGRARGRHSHRKIAF